ncbi:AAA family ATPase [Prochlorothrix hollandica]|uniref:Endonuclease GajA/Old nuclease/RecF-like AAA domain-containing protein n=1 Tax=Prochlorothrix hollandica PCC 9006 = CALU 1027 TaxID=317619 RepID=A0A0M2PN35_PROHO|nr:AAA family ATPase [Prochlorothrix hollandica]KKI98020.1 hypothetical protein PROH_19925 [Prochlorothrix hollandica PCC 9006 = CALU 1027]
MKLSKLRIKNFRAIGPGNEEKGIEINMMSSDIIFILGKNNAGKSSILNAYDAFINNLTMQENDFYGKNLKLQIEIEIELEADSDEERQLGFFDQNGITSIRKIWVWKTDPDNCSEISTFILFAGDWRKVDEKKDNDLKRLQKEFPETIWIRGMTTSQETVNNLKKLVQKVVLQSLKDKQEYFEAG